MRKLLLLILVFSVIFFLKVDLTKAACGVCIAWVCPESDFHCGGPPPYQNACYRTCSCVDFGYDPHCPDPTCGGGSYVCNTGCCDLGPTTPIVPSNPPGDPDPSPPAGCTATAATNLIATSTSSTSVNLSWTPGANGVYQAMWVSTNPDPQTGCAGSLGGTSVCPVRLDAGTTPLPESTSSYSITNLLTPNTVYYWKILTVQADTCYALASHTIISSCSLLPSSLTIPQYQSRTLTSSISTGVGIQNVAFSSNSPSYLSVSPASDTTQPYQTLATAHLPGSATVTSNAYVTGGTLGCTANSVITILPPSPWWQVKDSDVQSTGDLTSSVPPVASNFFGLNGPGGYPGVSAYYGTTDLTGANVSSTGWLVESQPIGRRVYDYAYFANQIPTDITAVMNSVDTADVAASLTSGGTPDTNTYYWYKYDGTLNGGQALTIPTTNIGTRKVILLVDNANVTITGNITLTDGQGFFMAIVNGNITVDPGVGGGASPNLEGLYLADGTFNDGLGSTKLWVRGSVAGILGVNMQRDLGGSANSDSSELFDYAPDQIMLYPDVLGIRKINWKEVAP